MNNELTLIQTYKKPIYRSYISETITCLEKLYDRDNGYVVGKVELTPQSDGKVLFTTPIYTKNINPDIHQEMFIKSCSPTDVSSVIESLTNTYTQDSGWTIGQRDIINVDELTSVVRVELTKQSKGPFL